MLLTICLSGFPQTFIELRPVRLALITEQLPMLPSSCRCSSPSSHCPPSYGRLQLNASGGKDHSYIRTHVTELCYVTPSQNFLLGENSDEISITKPPYKLPRSPHDEDGRNTLPVSLRNTKVALLTLWISSSSLDSSFYHSIRNVDPYKEDAHG